MELPEAQDVLRRAFEATGEVPADMAALLAALVLMPPTPPAKPRR